MARRHSARATQPGPFTIPSQNFQDSVRNSSGFRQKTVKILATKLLDSKPEPKDLPEFHEFSAKNLQKATFGISRFPDAGSTAKILFEHSDYVLYVAKERLRGQAILFSEKHQAEINETTGIMRGLQEADMDAELSINYQFVVDSQTGIPVGAEALARWTSPVLGMVSPSKFIKNAEKSGLINQVTETLLRNV